MSSFNFAEWIRENAEKQERIKMLQRDGLMKLLTANKPKAVSNLKDSYTRIASTLGKSVSSEIIKGRELPDIDDIDLAAGRSLKAAILYNDLRGFSQMIASNPDRRSLLVLDSFVSEMTRITSEFHGVVVDCAGDRIMSVFCRPHNDTSVRPIHEAVICAFWMQTVVYRVLNPILNQIKLPSISCGIGIDYGQVTVARVGIRNRNKLVFLGNAANWAAKIEDIAGAGETNISTTVHRNLPNFMTPANKWYFSPKPSVENPSWYTCNLMFSDNIPPQVP